MFLKIGKKFAWAFFIVVILIALLSGSRWFLFNVIMKDEVLDGLVSFRAAVVKDMEEGNSVGVYYVKNVKKADVHNINKYIDSAYGVVDTYRVIIESGQYLHIMLNYVLSDNYYVARKYQNGIDIPPDMEKASEIYNVIDSFIAKNIKPGMSDFDKEIAVHDYIVKKCSYGYPADTEDAYTAYGALVSGKCVCDGYAEAFFLMMSCLKIDCDIVVGDTKDGLHAWNQVKIEDNWYNVDLTWDDSLPDMGSYVKHTYVNLPDRIFEATHTWEKQFYRECIYDDCSFYNKRFYYYSSFEDYKKGIRLQVGKGKVLEAAVETPDSSFDLSFLFDYGNMNSINYLVEDLGEYKVIIVYLNLP